MGKAKAQQFLKPRLRLFLSADIIGSTALKQSPRSAISASTVDWFPALQGFYLETQRAFLGGWRRSLPPDSKDKQIHWGPEPELWKVIGDEILFTKELTDSHQLINTLGCWIAAVDSTREFIRRVDRRLDIKCTAWTAGFPLVNKEVALPRQFGESAEVVTDYFKEAGRLLNERYAKQSNHSKIAVDYIGPSIDIGFRLAQFSTARKFVVSVGVAYILSQSNRQPTDGRVTRLRYDGSSVLKGVYGGARYPLFWIDLAEPGDLALLEDKLTKPIEYNAEDYHKFCIKFFEEFSPYTFKPFIVSSTENDLVDKPDDYEKSLESIRKNYGLEIIGDKESERAAEEEQPPHDVQPVKPRPSAKSPTPAEGVALSVSALDFVKIFESVLNARSDANSVPSSGENPANGRHGNRSIGKPEKDKD